MPAGWGRSRHDAPRLALMRILLIDDDEDLRSLLAHYLTQEWPEAEIEQFDPLVRDKPNAAFPHLD